MKPTHCLLFSLLLAATTHLSAATPGSPGPAPAGLAQSDWSNIRAVYEAGRHAIKPAGSGWQARNPGQQWLTTFDGRGFVAQPDGGGWQWGLELQSYGFAGHERAVGGAPQVRAADQRITYQWDAAVVEWWVNDGRGLEHGFTVNERPSGAAGAPLQFDLTVRGGLRPAVLSDTLGLEFRNDQGAAVLTYTGLKAWDADGRPLAAHFVAAEAGVSLRVDERGARYPITIDPIAQQAYLKASNTGAYDHFGCAVAISGDTVVVGAWAEDSAATGVNGNQADNSAGNSGAAYVFVRSGTTWTQQAYLKASNPNVSDVFGWAVAISGDTVVVGAYQEASAATGVNGNQADNSASGAGAAYVFARSGTAWTQQAYLKASNTTATSQFGACVAVAGDTVVVGAHFEDAGATDSGAAYVFARSGSAWTQQAYLKASNSGAEDFFGRAVAVAGDTVVVGATLEDSAATGVNGNQADNNANSSGAAYVFFRSGTAWSQQAYLKASNTGGG